MRVRLTQSEVEQLSKSGLVEDSVEFVPNPLVYMVHSSKDSSEMEVLFLNSWITVTVPEDQIQKWSSGGDVGIVGCFRGIAILIEKDWSCLHGDETANEDTFPHPNA